MPTKQIHTTAEERRRLMELGKPIGKAIEELITIVTPVTFYRWCRTKVAGKQNPIDGQRKPKEIRELVIQIAKTTGFGYTRIIGELRKLGIKKISRSTVRNILKEEGIEPGPDRTSDSWTNFLARHKETLWPCDLFTVKTITAKGIREVYLLAFFCMETREVGVRHAVDRTPELEMGVRSNPAIHRQPCASCRGKARIIMHDKDTKFSKDFVETLKKNGIRANSLPKASPNLNGRTERFIGLIKSECLSKFIFFGQRYLEYVVAEYVSDFNEKRSHSSRGSLPPLATVSEDVITLRVDQIEIKSYVGGIIQSFERRAA